MRTERKRKRESLSRALAAAGIMLWGFAGSAVDSSDEGTSLMMGLAALFGIAMVWAGSVLADEGQ